MKCIPIEKAFELFQDSNYFAEDKDGSQYMYKQKPNIRIYWAGWYSPGTKINLNAEGYVIEHDKKWNESLIEKKPMKMKIKDILYIAKGYAEELMGETSHELAAFGKPEISVEEAFKLYPKYNYFAEDENGIQYLYIEKPNISTLWVYNAYATNTPLWYVIRLDDYKVKHDKPWNESLVKRKEEISVEKAFHLHPKYNYFAEDEDGSQYMYSERPVVKEAFWVYNAYATYTLLDGIRLDDYKVKHNKPWNESLVKRKEEISVEEAFKLYPKYNYFAEDRNGKQYMYSERPVVKEGLWVYNAHVVCLPSGNIVPLTKYKVKHDKHWNESLVKRKEEISIEKAFKLYPKYNYFAEDENGKQYMYSERPEVKEGLWVYNAYATYTPLGYVRRLDDYKVKHDKHWTKSLVKRKEGPHSFNVSFNVKINDEEGLIELRKRLLGIS